MDDNKVVEVSELSEAFKESGVKVSDLIVAKDNMLQALATSTSRIISVYATHETDEEKVLAFKNTLLKLVKLSQNNGAVQLILDTLTTKSEETINE